jgi:hypothetical protein
MTHEEAKAIVSAYQVRKTQASPAEYMRYMAARRCWPITACWN